ncbi:hypothetical protein QJQ45_025676 [Haematococcus lacustris]|nr:hypothetical protein QJQ45_025676 [Haematococcus lacustris]
MAAAATALRAEGVVYVDTTNAMSPARLLQAAEVMQAGTNTSEVLRCVHVARPHNIYELFDVLCEVNARCESLPRSTGHTQPGPGLPATPARPLVPRPCLLIVDSLSAVVSPVVGNPKHSQGFTLLACIGRLLRQLADTHRLAVVVTNHMVAARGGSEQEREREASSRSGSGLRVLVPALGEVWRSQVHTRLVLQLAPGSGPEGPRQAVLAASSISVAGASAWFTITAAGLQDYEPRLTREPPAAEAFPDDASSLVEGHRRPHPAPHPLPSQVRPHNSKRPDTQRSKRPDVAIADPPQQQSQSWPGEQARKPSVRQQALARAMAISASSSSAASATQAEDPPNPAGLERERVRQAALARALSSLARRPLTCKQMSEKLEEWDYHAALAAEVVADLQRTGDLDDASYAQRYVEGKWRVYKRSPALLHQELNSKGVSAAHIDNALCSLFGDGWRDSNNLVSRGEDDASQAAFKDICAEFGTHSTEAAAARPLSHDLKDAVLAQQSRLEGLPLATQTYAEAAGLDATPGA